MARRAKLPSGSRAWRNLPVWGVAALLTLTVGVALVAPVLLPSLLRSTDAALRPVARVSQVVGLGRIDTAAALSRNTYPTGVQVAYVANATAGRLPPVTSENAPLLFVEQNVVPLASKRELERLKPRRIVVLGNSEAVSDDVERELREEHTQHVHRVSGSTPQAVAAGLSRHLFPRGVRVAYVVDAGDPAAATLAASIAGTVAVRC